MIKKCSPLNKDIKNTRRATATPRGAMRQIVIRVRPSGAHISTLVKKTAVKIKLIITGETGGAAQGALNSAWKIIQVEKRDE